MQFDNERREAEREGIGLSLAIHEMVQKLILKGLSLGMPHEELVLHGGTSLRLLHRSPRRSLDMDFSTSRSVNIDQFVPKLVKEVNRDLSLLGLEVRETALKKTSVEKLFRFFLNTKDILPEIRRRVKVKLEILKIKNLVRERAELQIKTPIPTIFNVWCKPRNEHLIDKVCAIGGRTYLSARDIFDVWFLTRNGAKLDTERLTARFGEWKETPANLGDNLSALAEVGNLTLLEELNPLLPKTNRLGIEEIQELKETVLSLLEESLRKLEA